MNKRQKDKRQSVGATQPILNTHAPSPAKMVYHESSTRIAQPPGGHTSFSFADGSDIRRMPEPISGRGGVQSSTRIAQPPGGRGSFVFDDSAARGPGGEPERRHTNGLRRIDHHAPPPTVMDQPDVASNFRQPPGGRSSFTLDDNSTGVYTRAQTVPVMDYRQPPGGTSSFSFADGSSQQPPPRRQSDDSLTDFVAQQQQQQQQRAPAPWAHGPMAPKSFAPAPTPAPYLPPMPTHQALGSADPLGLGMRRQAINPPGGNSTFSFGWNNDVSGNHHASYNNIAKRNGGGFTGKALEHTEGPYRRAIDPTGENRAPWQAADGNGLHGGRSSSRVNAPPGGFSSFTFG